VRDSGLPWTTLRATQFYPFLEIWTTGELVRTWLPLRRIHRVVVRLPLWRAVAEGFRQGFNTTTERAVGSRTWSQWLEEQAS
jgi:hypothetical protein